MPKLGAGIGCGKNERRFRMTEVISKDEVLRALEKRMEKQPMDDEYLFGVYNGLKCAKGIIEALPGAAPQTAQKEQNR